MIVLSGILFIFLALLFGAITQEGDTASDLQYSFLPDFYYEQQEDLPYPTCSFGKGLEALGSPSTDMADYAFVATVAYRDNNITQGELDGWFGEDVAINEIGLVEKYRSTLPESPVSYKLITFPSLGNLALVAVRVSIYSSINTNHLLTHNLDPLGNNECLGCTLR